MQPVLKKDVPSGHASATEVGQAAYTLLQTCVIEKGVGGIAGDIGAFCLFRAENVSLDIENAARLLG